MEKICIKCKELKEHCAKGMCKNCYWKLYSKGKHIHLPSVGGGKGQQRTIYTNGVTEEIKPLIPKIMKKVLDNAIKNPRRLLDKIKVKEVNKDAKRRQDRCPNWFSNNSNYLFRI